MQGSDATGEFSVTKAIDNSGKSLPGGYSNKKLSATQLAAAQQAVKQANEMAATNFTGPVVTGSGDGYTQARANFLLSMCPCLGEAMYKSNSCLATKAQNVAVQWNALGQVSFRFPCHFHSMALSRILCDTIELRILQ